MAVLDREIPSIQTDNLGLINMKKPFFAALGVLGVMLASGCAMAPSQQRTQTIATPAYAQPELRDKKTGTGFVQAIDLERRELVLKGQGDKLRTIKVDTGVRNLAQIKAGAPVELTYYEALAVKLDKPATASGLPGQKPASMMRGDAEIVGKVTAVDQKNRRITLQSTQDAVTMKVPDDIDISTLKAGDPLSASYVQALATSVEPVQLRRKRRR